MGRVRTTLAISETDRDMQACLERAARSLAEAMTVCEKSLREHGGKYASSQARPTLAAMKAIQQMVDQVNRIPHLAPVEQLKAPLLVDKTKWDKASKIASENGHEDDLDYIQAIYEKMDPGFRRRQGGGMKAHKVMQAWRRQKGKEISARFSYSFQDEGDSD